jgi:hypothetical protein
VLRLGGIGVDAGLCGLFHNQNKLIMSTHNHDDEFIKQTVGKKLQKKADDLKDERVRNALLKADIKGLSRDDAKAKLYNIVDEILGE